jgi:hypothetical protein
MKGGVWGCDAGTRVWGFEGHYRHNRDGIFDSWGGDVGGWVVANAWTLRSSRASQKHDMHQKTFFGPRC